MGGTEGNNPSEIRVFDMIFGVCVTLCGALFFLFVTRSITGVAHSTWLIPIIGCIVFFSALSIFAVTVGIKKMIAPITMISFLPSIIFMPTITHICIVVMMTLIAMHGLYVMRQTLFNIMKIDIAMIVRSGALYVSFAIIMVITSQYYSYIKGDTNFVFDAGKHASLSNTATEFILQKSTIKDVSVKTMTVDEFFLVIIQNTETQDAKQGPHVSSDDHGMIVRWAGQMAGVTEAQIQKSAQEQAIAQMRVNISNLLGRDVSGDEMISDVLADVIEMQINQMMTRNAMLREYQVEIFSVAFFVVLISMAPIVRMCVSIVSQLLFTVLRDLKFVRITQTQREAEVIVF